MHLITIASKPYAVVNGKDYAVYRWYEPGTTGPIFVQLAGRTALAREDLPTEDWIVLPGRDRTHRLATAWRKPWFDYRPDATRKLAFLGASTEGSLYLLLRYVARRFGIVADETDLALRSGELASATDYPGSHLVARSADAGLSSADLVTLEIPSYFDADLAASLLTVF